MLSLPNYELNKLLYKKMLHILKYPPPPKITPPAGDQVFNNELMGGILYSNLSSNENGIIQR
jgi:hypothetical protein